jgi:hypothetical protein
MSIKTSIRFPLLVLCVALSLLTYGQSMHYRMEPSLTFDHVEIDQSFIHVAFTEKFIDYDFDDLTIELQEEDGTDQTSKITTVEASSRVQKIVRGTNYLKISFSGLATPANPPTNSSTLTYILIIRDSKGNASYKRFIYAP